MARFVGRETNVGSELLTRLLVAIVVIIAILVILVVWHPLWAHDFLVALGLLDLATGGLGR